MARLQPKKVLNRDLLLAEFRYEPDTGYLFRRVLRQGWGTRNAGKPVGSANTEGYLVARLVGMGLVKVHRIIWVMAHGTQPDVIDHIDGNRTNNRLSNLRSVTDQRNIPHRLRPNSNSKTGALGVSLVGLGPKYKAMRRHRYLGCFNTIEEASAAYWAARTEEVA